MKEILTNELLDLMAENYLIFKSFVTVYGNEAVITFEQFVERQLGLRESKIGKGGIIK